MEYSITFQDNISKYDFNNRARGTTTWIKENRDKFDWAKDPNAYEMTNLFLFGAKYASEGSDIDMKALDEMWKIRSQDFDNCDISKNNFVYAICEDSYNSAKKGRPLVNDENSHHALRKMAGIGLYLKQQQRDGEKPHFENFSELQELIESSKTLKGVHPELFEKYKFGENIEVICSLMERNLDEKEKESLSNLKSQLMQNKKVEERSSKPNKIPETR